VAWHGRRHSRCQDCGHGKVHSQAAAVAQPIPVPARQFAHLHMDLIGPLPCSQAGHTYLMTIIDWSTRWFEAQPMSDISAASCMKALFSTWIRRHEVPDNLTSDRGP
jgi:hypothetical protein